MTDIGVAPPMWLAPDKADDEKPGGSTGPGRDNRDTRGDNRCGHFSVSVATLSVPGVFVPMQVPIYRCALAELMIQRLRDSDEGRRLADSLEAAPLDGFPRLVGGPDLEAITTTTCTVDRCRRSCQHGFTQILADIGVDASLPED